MDTRHSGFLFWINKKQCVGFISYQDYNIDSEENLSIPVDSFSFKEEMTELWSQLNCNQKVSFQIERGHKSSSAIQIKPIKNINSCISTH